MARRDQEPGKVFRVIIDVVLQDGVDEKEPKEVLDKSDLRALADHVVYQLGTADDSVQLDAYGAEIHSHMLHRDDNGRCARCVYIADEVLHSLRD